MMDGTDNLVRLRQLIASGMRFSLIDGQVAVNGPGELLKGENRAWLKQQREWIAQCLQQQPEMLADAEWTASDAQMGMWASQRLHPQSSAYHLLLGLRSAERLDRTRLLQALRAVIQRHDALRSGLVEKDGVLVSRRLPVLVPGIEHLKGAALTPEALTQAIEQFGDKAFDLGRGPLLRMLLVESASSLQFAALGFPAGGTTQADLLFIACHHVAVDFWGLQLLLQDLDLAYRQGLKGLAASAPSYRTFARWQEDYLHSVQGQEDADFWQEHWAQPLPSDTPWQQGGRLPSQQGQRLSRALDASQTRALRQLAQQLSTTPFVLLLTVFAWVQSRYRGQSEVVLGSPVAGRSSPQAESTVGHFVNLLTLKLPSQATTFAQLLERVHELWLSALDHSDYPFPRILTALHAIHGQAALQLPDAAMVWHQASQTWLNRNLDPNASLLRRAEDIWPGSGQRGAAYGLILAVLDRGDNYRLEWTWDVALHDLSSVRQQADDTLNVLVQLPALLNKDLNQMSLLKPSCLVAEPLPLQTDTTLWQRMLTVAAKQGHARALVDAVSGEHCTWQQLILAAETLAEKLHHQGVGVGDRVGLWLQRGITWPIACAACWRLGAAFVPLDLNAPAQRLYDLLLDAAIGVIVDDQQHPWPSSQNELNGEVTRLPWRYDGSPLSPLNAALPALDFTADIAAYAIYTSGSSGRPKGVQIRQRNLLAYSDGFERQCRQTAETVASITPATFDVSLFELAAALLQGRQLVILPDLLTLDRSRWQSLLFQHPIDMLYVPPGLLDSLRESWQQSGQPPPKRLMTGVEPIRYATLSAWLDMDPAMDVINQYGPTETTIAVTVCRVSPRTADQDPMARVPLDQPMPGVRIELRDQMGRLVPQGSSGEAYIFGELVGQGYIGHAASNADGYGEDPSGEHFYRTGDWMRINAEGQLVYLGRADHQVKLRGVRVELGEVRSGLQVIAGVHAAWVEARKHETGTPYLVAHVASQLSQQALLSALRERLPPLLIPAHIQVYDSLPSNRHGKVDAAALANIPLETQQHLQRPAETVEENCIWEAWAAELPEPPTSVGDNFFALGGHSMIAARIASRLLNQGYAITVPDLLRYPDIAGQAAQLSQTPLAGETESATPLLAREANAEVAVSGPVLPFHFTLWAHEAMHGPTSAYTVALALLIPDPIDEPVIRQQWQNLVQRHEALRTRFVETALGLQQQVLNRIDLPVYCEQHSLGAHQTLESATDALIAERLAQPLSLLNSAPLWRLHCITMSDGGQSRTLILGLFHHAIFDGTSLRALVQSLQANVWQSVAESASAADMIDAVVAVPPVEQQAIEFWQQALADRESHDLPRRQSPLAPNENAVGVEHRVLSAEQLQGLQQAARELSCTPFIVALTLFQIVMARFSHHLNGSVAVPVDLRTPAMANVIGGLINTVSIPTGFDWQQTLAQAISSAADFFGQSHQHKSAALDVVIKNLEGSAEEWLEALFGSLFVWEQPDVDSLPQGLQWSRPAPLQPKTDLEFVVASDGLYLYWRRQRYEEVTAIAVINAYTELLTQLPHLLRTRIADLPLLSQQAFAEQVAALSDTEPFTPLDHHVFDYLNEHLEHRGDVCAIRYWQRQWSYKTLMHQVRCYAAGLSEGGVQVGDRVAFALDRSPETVAAMIAIWYVGAAYVPLDLRWPLSRMMQVLEASDCELVLVTSADSELAAALAGSSAPRVLPLSEIDRAPRDAKPAIRTLEQTAYVLFTSGSTGTPKGVVINHRNLAAFLRWVRDFYPAEDFSGLLAVTTFAFDLSVFELFGTLTCGGTVCLANDPLSLLDPALRSAYDGCLSALNSVPSAAEAWLDANAIPAGIRTVNLAGELLPQATVERLYRAGVGRVLDLWGPTEDTTYSMVALRQPSGQPTIGRPIRDTQAWLVDARLQPIPRGIKGELILGGYGLSAGYLNDPERTALAFMNNPWLSDCPHWAPRIYRTGDVAWQDSNDQVHYCARADDQIKLRGQRLEPGEIEAGLQTHSMVRKAVVILIQPEGQGPCLFACVEALSDITLSFDDLADHLNQSLPSYMIPARWLQLQQWPLNRNGKIDRKALQRWAPQAQLTIDAEDTAASPLEHTLLSLCAEVAPGVPISLTRPLVQLGLDSIVLLKLNFALQQRLRLFQPLPLSAWLEAKTLRGLAARLHTEHPDGTWTQLRESNGPGEAADKSPPVLVCVHALGGEITGFCNLAEQLPEPWQVWAVALPEDAAQTVRLEQLAQRYVNAWDEIGAREVILLGYSLGGVIASHMLAPLQQRGIHVHRLVLLDSFTPKIFTANPTITNFSVACQQAEPDWRKLYAVAVAAGWLPAGLVLDLVQPRLKVMAHLIRLSVDCELPLIQVPTVHLASRTDDFQSRQRWTDYLRGEVQWLKTDAWHGAVLGAEHLHSVISALTLIPHIETERAMQPGKEKSEESTES